ncbi:MAG: phosphatidylserine/phosphatidylglycerophosphate/cardiolipin synthase family protein [Endomicrobium sp.]|jgi:cardiolipin synthase|nr:phosphatidylserine/phosphatidylglycerophosphate/cardiolipin synthase family protein [Endomicrobium sp.]
MKNKVIIFVIFSLIFFLSSCHRIYKKQQILHEIDNSTFDPKEVFIYENNLYLSYSRENENFYLYAKLPKEGSRKNRRNAIIETEIVQKIPEGIMYGAQEVVLVKNILQQASDEIVEDMSPQTKNKGVMLLTGFKDVILYRDSAGAVKFCDPSRLPEGIEVTGKIDKKTIRKNTYSKIIKILKDKYPDNKRFVLPIDTIPLIPYVYVDMGKNIAAAVKLPDYYEVQKETSPLGFSLDLIYSFIIKSHVFAIIKSPFTSLHRLFSTAMYSLYSGLSPQIENINGEIPPLYEGDEMMDIKAFERYLDFNITEEKYMGRARILVDGNSFFPDFIEQVAKAKEKINIRLYIFKADPYSITIADQLKEKSKEGVKVKVLIDEINTILNWTKAPEQLYSKDYVMPNIKKYLKENSKVKVRTHLNTWANFDHSKVIIIDDKLAYTGGMNFGEEYRYFWHDMMIALEGPVVTKLQDDFDGAWAFSGAGGDFSAAARAVFKPKRDYDKGVEQDMFYMRLLYTKPSSAEIFSAQIEAIKRAKKRIYIQNAYFSDVRIIQELINARARGVDIRIILPSENDNGMMDKSNMVKANIMFNNGIKIYFYPKMSHIKAAIYDNWACVGSANFDKLSLYINNEMSLGISNPAFVGDLNNKIFVKSFAESKLMEKELDISPGDYIMSFLAAQG